MISYKPFSMIEIFKKLIFKKDAILSFINSNGSDILWKPTAEAITAARTILAADNGKTFYISGATGFVTTLPPPALGLRFRFVLGPTAPTSGNHTVVTNGSANIIKGGLAGAEVDDTTDFDTSTADDTVSLVASNAVAGDWFELESDGTNWYVRGWSAVRAGLTLTQASG